jgi:hypothetical protein
MTKSAASRKSSGPSVTDLTFTAASAEDLSRCVVMLHREFTETIKVDGKDVEVWLRPPGAKPKPKRDRHLGTAFLAATASDAFLVTAAHVARRMDREARLSYPRHNGHRGSLALSDLLGKRGRNLWVFHPPADVAVARIPKPPAALRGCFLPAELLVGKCSAPSGALDLLAIGFPLGLASDLHFAPIAKRAHAASGIVRFRGEEMSGPAHFFLLDQPAMGGYSGAPVFIAPQARLGTTGEVSTVAAHCVGLLSQTISDETVGQFAAVVPSSVIRRLLAKVGR